MYATIKDKNKVLINRLSNDEAILLKSIADEAKEGSISFTELTGETGDFDGIMITVTPKEPEEEVNEIINETEETETEENLNS